MTSAVPESDLPTGTVPAGDLPPGAATNKNAVPHDDLPHGLATKADPSLDHLANLWVQAGGDPSVAEQMAHVAFAESNGRADARGPDYEDGGHTYHAEGLWQISTVHGAGNWSDPLTNARKAVELYRAQGLGPWQDSRNKGAGGGWGQYVGRAEPDRARGDAAGAHQAASPSPARSSPAPANTPLPKGGMRELLAQRPPSKVQQAGLDLGGFPHAPGIAAAIGGASQHVHDVLAPVKQWGANLKEFAVFDAAKRPLETFANVEGAPGRFVMPVATKLLAGKMPSLKDVGDAQLAFHSPERTQELTNALEHQYAQTMHMPDFSNATGWLKTVADISFQTATDPFTYVPVSDLATMLSKGAKVMAHGAVAYSGAREAIKFLEAQVGKHENLSQMLGALNEWYSKGKNITKSTATAVGAIFNDRLPHLHKAFDDTGKAAYVALDSAADAQATAFAKRDARLFDETGKVLKKSTLTNPLHADVRAAWLRDQYRFGDDAARKSALDVGYIPGAGDAKFTKPLGYVHYRGGVPDFSSLEKTIPKDGPLAKAWELYKNPKTQYDLAWSRATLTRELVRRRQVSSNLADWIRHGPDGGFRGLKVDVPVTRGSTLTDWVEQQLHPVQWINKLDPRVQPAAAAATKALRGYANIWKTGIMANFAPHGIFNVGSITWMRGGLLTAARGLHYGLASMGKRGGPAYDDLLARLTKTGGTTSYWRSPEGQNWIARLPGIKQWIPVASEILEHLENGYRASYLEMLDKLDGTHGLPMAQRGIDEELAKGARVLNDIGNYKHMTMYVKFLHGLGGVFAQFGADIAPRATWNEVGRAGLLSSDKSMRHLPLTPLLARTQRDFNDQGDAPPGFEFEFGGPTAGGIRGVVDPSHYWTSGARIGPLASQVINEGVQLKTGNAFPEDPGQGIAQAASAMIPGYGSLEDVPGFEGLDPYAQPDDMPTWMRMWFLLAGGYTRSDPDTKSARRERKYFEKQAAQ